MAKIGQKIVIFVIGSLIADCAIAAANNILEGKTIFGKKKKENKKNKMDWLGNVRLGSADYKVV